MSGYLDPFGIETRAATGNRKDGPLSFRAHCLVAERGEEADTAEPYGGPEQEVWLSLMLSQTHQRRQ